MAARLRSLVFPLTFAFLSLLVSCAKDGPMGPAGPTGNADVRTHVVILADSDFVSRIYWFQTSPTTAQGYVGRAATIVDSSITRGIMDSGTVLVYFRPLTMLSDTSWEQLPVSINFGDYGRHFASQIGLGHVIIYYWHESNTTGGATPPAVSSVVFPPRPFKYIVISGSSLNLMKRSGVNLKDPEAVARFSEVETTF
jgi:hypothetical protein